MSRVKIIACGLSPSTLTLEAHAALSEADFFIGARRLLASFVPREAEQAEAYLAQEVADIVASRPNNNCAVLVSGDSGFYSAAAGICQFLDEAPQIYPGISSLSYFFAKLGRPWHKAKIISCHGRKGNLLAAVRRNQEVFCLTGKNTTELLRHLTDSGCGALTVTIGENLGFTTEKIRSGKVEELARETDYSSLAVLLVDNPAATKAITTGIMDTEFCRGSLPMTKSAVRAQVQSLLQLEPDDICLDLGCGTGSVAIEMGLGAYEGQVMAVDKEEEAGQLLAANALRFQLDNVSFHKADIGEFLATEPLCDKIFLGGGGAKIIPQVLEFFASHERVKRLVLTAISLESLEVALAAIKALGLSAKIMQIQVTRAKHLGTNHLLMAENPTFILEASR
ncbi:MAG: precorrin-6y C5,15-methyltransferase (decarboxylating) subunit CbiE [Eubacteriales bacterium]|nr:precorrin-6y C5,15-methyltransferase (decarboxylating) subunit CbiE [Eubacteriales bacterium]